MGWILIIMASNVIEFELRCSEFYWNRMPLNSIQLKIYILILRVVLKFRASKIWIFIMEFVWLVFPYSRNKSYNSPPLMLCNLWTSPSIDLRDYIFLESRPWTFMSLLKNNFPMIQYCNKFFNIKNQFFSHQI